MPFQTVVHTCLLSSFLRAISAAFSSFDIPAILGPAEAGAGGLASALPLSDGVGDRAIDDGLGLASEDEEGTREPEVVRDGCGASVDCGLPHSFDRRDFVTAGGLHGSDDTDGMAGMLPKPKPLTWVAGAGAVSNAPVQGSVNADRPGYAN